MMRLHWLFLGFGLVGCTTANDVALREAQASIEQARSVQVLATGLGWSANWTAAAAFVLVVTLCAIVLMLAWGLSRRLAARPGAGMLDGRRDGGYNHGHDHGRGRVGERGLGRGAQVLMGPGLGVPFGLLSPEEQRFVLALRAQQAQRMQQPLLPFYVDEPVDPWGGQQG